VRVIECPFCGETLAAANDDELVKTVRRHMDERHPEQEYNDTQVRELAYDASDS
jgi:predicted small metal-binding protein